MRLILPLVVVGTVSFFFGLGSVGLIGPDESRHAEAARGMLDRGDWVTPYLRGEPWFDKPPLYYWAAAGSMWALGETEAAGRQPGGTPGSPWASGPTPSTLLSGRPWVGWPLPSRHLELRYWPRGPSASFYLSWSSGCSIPSVTGARCRRLLNWRPRLFVSCWLPSPGMSPSPRRTAGSTWRCSCFNTMWIDSCRPFIVTPVLSITPCRFSPWCSSPGLRSCPRL